MSHSSHYAKFRKTFAIFLDTLTSKKKKILRGNQKPHIDKNLRKVIVKRTERKNKVSKTKHSTGILKYKNLYKLHQKLSFPGPEISLKVSEHQVNINFTSAFWNKERWCFP